VRANRQRAHSRPARTLRIVFESLDFVYLPSRDVAAEAKFFTESLAGKLVFAIEAFGTRVAMVELAENSPSLLLAGHLEGDRPVLVFRVGDLEQAVGRLERGGKEITARFEIPHGPGAEVATPGPQRIALYELTRPQAARRLAGRRDF
jgi:hypothetical protein